MLHTRSSAISLALHALFVVLLCWFSLRPPLRRPVTARAPVPLMYLPLLNHAGRGGGAQSALPASRGSLPRPARTFVPPQAMLLNVQPRLVFPVAMDAPPEIASSSNALGDPHGVFSGLSGGPGGPHGIGSGAGPSIGSGEGDSGGVASGRGVSMPVPLHMVEPEYSDMARKAKLSGTVLVACVVDVNGRPRDLRVARGIGLGLDEKALEAVAQWLFKPGAKAGRPVAVQALIEVTFRIL